MARRIAIALLCGIAGLPVIATASSPPPWVQAQVSSAIPEHDDKTGAVLLYSESVLTLQPDGKRKHLDRSVYRILRNEGQEVGIVRVNFDPRTRINDLRAWSIPKEGKPYEVGLRESVETSLFGVQDGELFTDL